MEYKELLAAFAAKYGIEGLDGADGAAELDVEGIRVELLDDPHTRSVLVCAEIGHQPHEVSCEWGRMMLQANFLLRGTDGATLCQDPETGTYAIVRPFPLSLTDVAALAAGIESLANQVENWRRVLDGLHVAENNVALPDGDSHHDMIANGYFHV